MKITYDKSANAIYIKFNEEFASNKVTSSCPINPKEVEGAFIVFDFDENKRLLGIEILEADKRLPNSLLEIAEKIG
jgi:uncharacterized protein YuzE